MREGEVTGGEGRGGEKRRGEWWGGKGICVEGTDETMALHLDVRTTSRQHQRPGHIASPPLLKLLFLSYLTLSRSSYISYHCKYPCCHVVSYDASLSKTPLLYTSLGYLPSFPPSLSLLLSPILKLLSTHLFSTPIDYISSGILTHGPSFGPTQGTLLCRNTLTARQCSS